MILVSKEESYSDDFVKIIFGGQETKKLLYSIFETFIMCMPSHICWGWAGEAWLITVCVDSFCRIG